MKKLMSITASLDEPRMVKKVVEKLASRHVDKGYTLATVPQQWKAIESSCIQADVMGNFEELNIPFTGAFLFTCVKEMNGLFNLEWSASLS